MSKKFRGRVTVGHLFTIGSTETPDTTEVVVLDKDSSGDVLKATGTTVPSDAESGFAKGCIFIDTDVVTGTSGTYDNVGTTTSCNFDLIGLGGGTGGNTLDSAYDQGGAGVGGTVTVDAADVLLNLSTGYNLKINSAATGTQTVALEINDNTGGTITDGLLFTATNSIVDAIDASATNIDNAINVGANIIVGTAAVINFTAFDVDASGNVICNDLTVNGTHSIATLNVSTAFNLGTDGVGVDASFYSTTAGDLILWDASEKTLLATDSKIHFGDNDELHFGSGSATGTGDWKMYSDGTNLLVTGVVDVATQNVTFGTDAIHCDLVWQPTTTGAEVTFDWDSDRVQFDGVDLRMNDDDLLIFGDDGDWTIDYNDPDLIIAAGANVADQTVKFGDATNDVDVQMFGDTSGDTWLFDSSSDQVTMTDIGQVMTETAVDTESLDITNAATSVSCVEINSTGALTNGLAGLAILSTGALATGGAGLLVDYKTGSPDAAARMVELQGTGKDLMGIYADVDGATNDVYTFHSGGAIATAKAVVAITSDGTLAASDSALLDIRFTGDDANVPILLELAGTGSGIDVTGISMATESNGTTAWNANLTNAADAALGVSLRTHHDSASPAAADEIFFHTMIGEDAGSAATEYVRVAGQVLLATAGQEDGEYVVSVAADNGTLTQALVVGPQLNSANTGISVGSGAGAAAITSEGTQDLILQTNYGTTSSKMTITDGAAGAVTFDMDAAGLVAIASTDAGALGAQLTLSQTGGSQAASDVLARFLFTGQDVSNAANNYGQIDCVVVASTDGSERGRLDFYAGDPDAGGVIIGLQVDNDGTNGIVSVGDNSAAGVLQSVGNQDLTLKTGNATTSNVTITDAANGDVTVNSNGSGALVHYGAATAADSLQRYVPTLMKWVWEHTDPDANDDITVYSTNSPKILVVDAWLDMDTAEGGAMTVTLRDTANGGGNALTSALDANATGKQNSTAMANNELAASSSLFMNFSGNPGTAAGSLYMWVVHLN